MTAQASKRLPDLLSPRIKSEETSDLPTPLIDHPAQTFVSQRLEAGSHYLYSKMIMATERQLLRQAPICTEGNQQKATAVLGTSPVTLRGKLRTLGIEPSDFATS